MTSTKILRARSSSLILPASFCAALALACSSSPSSAPAFGGKGATVDPGPGAALAEANPEKADPCVEAAPPSQDARVEDFEDGDHRLFGGLEREGYWYTASDHTPDSSIFPPEGAFEPTRLPDAPADARNVFAAHLTASGQKEWGATWGTTLRHVGAAKCGLNVGGFVGLRFRARGKGTVGVRFGVPETVAAEFGGRCTERCWDVHFTLVRLTEDWQSHEVRWEQLQQEGWGKSVRFDPQRLLSIELMAKPAMLPADVWIDDLVWISDAPKP